MENENYDYDVEVTYNEGSERIRVQCRDKTSPLTAIEKTIKAIRAKQRKTCIYNRVVGLRIASITPVELL